MIFHHGGFSESRWKPDIQDTGSVLPRMRRSRSLQLLFRFLCETVVGLWFGVSSAEVKCCMRRSVLLQCVFAFRCLPSAISKRLVKAPVVSRQKGFGQLDACRPVVHGFTLSCRVIRASPFKTCLSFPSIESSWDRKHARALSTLPFFASFIPLIQDI